MADNWSLSVIMIFLLSLKLQDKVLSQNVKKISPDPTYVTLGDTLVLNVTYDFTGKVGVAWRNSSGTLLYIRTSLGGEDNPDKRVSLEGQATLILKNTALYDNGTYTVTVTPISKPVSKTFDVIIQVKPSSTTLKSVPDIAIIAESVKIICKAEGLPEPTYVIYYNGAKLTDKGEIAINPVNYSHAGEYRCNATNKLGMDSVSYLLKVTDVIATPITKASSTMASETTPRTISNASEKSKSDCTGCAWYIILVTLVCGIIIGMIFLYGIMLLRRRFKSKTDVSKPEHNYDTPETHPEGAADSSAYQELDLRNKEPENSYQALRMNTRERIDNETEIEDEAGYQTVG